MKEKTRFKFVTKTFVVKFHKLKSFPVGCNYEEWFTNLYTQNHMIDGVVVKEIPSWNTVIDPDGCIFYVLFNRMVGTVDHPMHEGVKIPFQSEPFNWSCRWFTRGDIYDAVHAAALHQEEVLAHMREDGCQLYIVTSTTEETLNIPFRDIDQLIKKR